MAILSFAILLYLSVGNSIFCLFGILIMKRYRSGKYVYSNTFGDDIDSHVYTGKVHEIMPIISIINALEVDATHP